MRFKLSTSSEVSSVLAGRLKAQRLAQLLSQEELASKAGVSVGTVRSFERTGQATLDSFLRLLAALGLTGELEDRFELRVTSIAEMEKAAGRPRQRAPRKVRPT